jgi:chromate reductase, NAD(P)H dehydrogenase (quinone)
MTRVLVLPGSVRDGSPSIALAGAAAREMALLGHSVTRLSLAEYALPIFDSEPGHEQTAPQAAQQLARQFAAHDAVLIVTPEHNGGIPALLKNAIDWVGHPGAGGIKAVAEDRIFALASADSHSLGGFAALTMLRQVLETGLGALVVPEQFALPGADRAFDDRGALADPQRHRELRRMLEALTRRAELLRRGNADHRT